MTTTLTMVESRRWRGAEACLLQIGAHLQIGLDGRHQTQPKMRVLAVAEGAPTAFRGIVGGFPRRVRAGTRSADGSDRRSRCCCCLRSGASCAASASVCQILYRRSASCGVRLCPQVVFPDREPVFEERAGHAKLDHPTGPANSPSSFAVRRRSGSQPDGGTGCGAVHKSSRARRTWSQSRQGSGGGSTFGSKVGRAAQFGDRGWIRWRQLEPLANGAMVDAELAADGSSRRDVFVQRMDLGNAQRAARQAPAIAFRICIMLVGCRRRATQTYRARSACWPVAASVTCGGPV